MKLSKTLLDDLLQIFAEKIHTLDLSLKGPFADVENSMKGTSSQYGQKVLITNREYKNTNDYDLIISFGNKKINWDGHQRQYSMIKKGGNVKWIVEKDRLFDINLFVNGLTAKSKLLKKILSHIEQTSSSRFIPLPSLNVYFKKNLKINELLNKGVKDVFSIYLGPEGYDRNITLAYPLNSKQTEYAKLLLNRNGISKVKKEHQAILRIDKMELGFAETPEVLHCDDGHISRTLFNNIQDYSHSIDFDSKHESFLKTLMFKTYRIKNLKHNEIWNKSIINKTFINGNNAFIHATRIKNQLNELEKSFNQGQEFISCLAHGDFTPWNVKVNEESLYVFDYEYAHEDTPAFFDLFHYYMQTGILLSGLAFEQIRCSIFQKVQTSTFKNIVDRFSINLDEYLKLYLFRIVSYNLATFQYVSKISEDQKRLLDKWEEGLKYYISQSTLIQRTPFTQEFNEYLGQFEHAYLKFSSKCLSKLPSESDLDIVMRKKNLAQIIEFVNSSHRVKRCKTINKSFMTTLELFLIDGTFLSVDLIHKFKRKSLVYLDTTPVIRSATKNKFGINVPSLRFDLENALLFYSLNGSKIPQKYISFFGKSNYAARQRVTKYLSKKYNLQIDCYSQLFTLSKDHFSKITNRVKRKNRFAIQDMIRHRVSYITDTIQSFFKNNSIMISFSGVDGAGKSTLINSFKETLEKTYRREVVLLRHRPGILPMLKSFIVGKDKAEKVASETTPRMGTNKSFISSYLRFAYYYIDYFFGQFFIKIKYQWRGKVILYDRYYYDFIVDPKRSNIKINKRIVQFLLNFIKKPNINFMLWADPKIIRSRKTELESTTISVLSENYKILFDNLSRQNKNQFLTIQNVDISTTLARIVKEYSRVA